MRKLLLLCLFSVLGLAQNVNNPSVTARRVVSAASLPATCTVGDVYFKTAATVGTYQCLTTNTWTAMGGGGGAFPAGSLGACQTYLTASTFNGNVATCYVAFSALGKPGTFTVTQGGTPGMTTYGYTITWANAVGWGVPSDEVTSSTGNATLSMTNYNIITPPTCPSGASGYYLWRTTGPGTLGYIETGTGLPTPCATVFNDIGQQGDGGNICCYNTTGDASQGVYISTNLTVPSNGDIDTPEVIFGSNRFQFSHDVALNMLDSSKVAMGYHGTGQNVQTVLGIIAESTDNTSINAGLFGGYTSGSVGARSVLSFAGNTGTNPIPYAAAFTGRIDNNSSSSTEGMVFDALSPEGAGTCLTCFGFRAHDFTAATASYGFYSELNSAASKWAFYGAGTAKAHFGGVTDAPLWATTTNCANAASPAVCGSSAAGAVAIPTGITTVTLVVNTTAITANSEISLAADDSVTIAATTCNNTLATLTGGLAVTARTPGTSFTITYNGTIATNPLCVTYKVMN